jgi:hypothetical protein
MKNINKHKRSPKFKKLKLSKSVRGRRHSLKAKRFEKSLFIRNRE